MLSLTKNNIYIHNGYNDSFLLVESLSIIDKFRFIAKVLETDIPEFKDSLGHHVACYFDSFDLVVDPKQIQNGSL